MAGKQPVPEKESTIVKKIPAADQTGAGVTCTTAKKQVYVISQNLSNGKFTLWKQVKGGYQRLDNAKSPIPLYDKIPWGN